MHECLIVSLRILSGDGDWQVRCVDVEKKGYQDGFLWDAILELRRRNLLRLLLPAFVLAKKLSSIYCVSKVT